MESSSDEDTVCGWTSSYTACNCVDVVSSGSDGEGEEYEPYADDNTAEDNFSGTEEEDEVAVKAPPPPRIKKPKKYFNILQEETDFIPE